MRREDKAPAGSMRYPGAAAIAFITLIVGSIWLQSREGLPEPVAVVTAEVSRPKIAKAKPPALSDQVLAFAAFAKEDLPTQSPGARASTASGMRLLAQAIAARGNSVLWRDRAKRLEEAAMKVEQAADSTAAAQLAHDTLVQVADWIAGLPRVVGGHEAMRSAARSIAPGEPLRDQTGKVEEFFGAVARALAGANNTST